jgi:hypothetical protein
MPSTLPDLIEDLVSSDADGTPVVLLVDDYRERADLARSLIEESKLFDVDLLSFPRLEDAVELLPLFEAQHDKAAMLLVDPDEAAAFGPWLDACREALPSFARFVIVLVFRTDLPVLAKAAPAFMSWAKALEIPHLKTKDGSIPADEVAAELRQMEEITGLGPEAYLEAWQRGKLPDTHSNTVWLNLAFAAVGRENR